MALNRDSLGISQRSANARVAEIWGIRYVIADTAPSMLIRPDACIAWTGEENSMDRLEEALHRWSK
jgi:hypothetical protein